MFEIHVRVQIVHVVRATEFFIHEAPDLEA